MSDRTGRSLMNVSMVVALISVGSGLSVHFDRLAPSRVTRLMRRHNASSLDFDWW